MIDRRILQEARTLASAGYDVTVLSGFECKEPDAYERDGVTVKRYVYDWSDPRRDDFNERFGRGFASVAWQPVRVLNRLAGGLTAHEAFVLKKALEHRFDIVHVHDYPMLRVGAEAASRRNARLVYDSHEFYSAQASLPVATQKKYLEQEGKLIKRCDAVITVNPYLAAMFARAHGIQEPLVILNAAERKPESGAVSGKTKRDRRIALGLPPDEFLILYQGWISAERNLEPMIAAMEDLPAGSHLVIVGYGDHLTVLRDLVASLGIEHRVLFYGRVESDDLPALTLLCDLGVVPYRAVDEMHRYCSPNKLFEFSGGWDPDPCKRSALFARRDCRLWHRMAWRSRIQDGVRGGTAGDRR